MILAAVAAAAAVAVGSWWAYATSRLGRVEFTNDGPPLMAQVLPGSGDVPLGGPFDVVSRSVVSLPEGDYRLRVHGSGRLGRTYRFAVHRGEARALPLSLDEGRLLGQGPREMIGPQPPPREAPIPFAPVTAAVALSPGRTDLIERLPRGLARRDATTGRLTWEVAPAPDPSVGPPGPTTWLSYLGESTSHPDGSRLVEPASDLDGDGTADLVWAFRDLGAFLAVSGGDGSILWDYTVEPDGAGGARPGGPDLRGGPGQNRWFGPPGPLGPGARWRNILGPAAMADVDGDGAADLVVAVSLSEDEDEVARRLGPTLGRDASGQQPAPFARRSVVAISGRTGRTLWHHPLDAAFAAASRSARELPIEVVRGRGGSIVRLVEGTRWVGLDAATGRPAAGAVDLGFEPVGPARLVDLDGDGEADLLALGPGQAAGQQELAAFSGASGRTLWAEPVPARYERLFGVLTPPDWPVAFDLDGDGRPEIVVPDIGPMPPGPGYRGLRLLDGATGRSRWTRPMRPETAGGDGLVDLLAAPDLDGDGVRDLIATSYFLGRSPSSAFQGRPPVPERAYVDAFSGRDGRPLWWWHRDLPADQVCLLRPPSWWGRGPDGWPLLAVGLGGPDSRVSNGNGSDVTPPIVHNLEASTGRDVATAVGLGRAGVADLDGDGLPDLWGEVDGLLRAYRGEPPAAWRALGQFTPAEPSRSGFDFAAPTAADLDGDGVGDVITTDARSAAPSILDPIAAHALEPALSNGFGVGAAPSPPLSKGRTAEARSGRDGRLIWRASLREPWAGWWDDRSEFVFLTAHRSPAGDLDGDGTPDLIAQLISIGARPAWAGPEHAATLPLWALSGRTGRQLWAAGPLPLGFRAFGNSQVNWARPAIVGPGEAPDLVVLHSSPFAPAAPSPGPGSPTRPHLARVSGRTGQVLWDVALAEGVNPSSPWFTPPGLGDLDGDGGLDLALVGVRDLAAAGAGHDLTAISLRDGRPLWGRQIDGPVVRPGPVQLAVADLDGDHRAEVVVGGGSGWGGRPGYVVRVVEGRDGGDRWAFRAGSPDQQPEYGEFFLAGLDGRGPLSVGLGVLAASNAPGLRRFVVLDARGRARIDRDLTGPADDNRPGQFILPLAADLTGDGRDEMFFATNGRFRAWGPDLAEIWSRPHGAGHVGRVVPGTAGRPAALWLDRPAVALDGADGRPRWSGHAAIGTWSMFQPSLLDPGGPGRAPLLIANGTGSTTCSRAIPTTAGGAYEPPRGDPTPPGLARDDPRWLRALPWAELAAGDEVRSAAVAAVALGLLGVGLPLALLRLVAGRRARSLRLVMALPAAAAIPLVVFKAIEPSIPAPPAPWPSSPGVIFLLASLAGAASLAAPALAGWDLARRRWRPLARLLGLVAAASLAVGTIWLAFDRRTMPAIERYDPSGWYWPLVPGVVVAGILASIGRSAIVAGRFLVSRGRATRDGRPG